MRTPRQIAEKFSSIDAHDDTIEGFVFIPASNRRSQAKVEVTLFRRWGNKRRVIQFSNCANIGLCLDADVLLINAPINTSGLDATADSDEIKSLMRKHKRSWHVSYQKSIDPLAAKFAASKGYVLFRVRLFGGVLEIIAKSFSIKRASSLASV